MKLNPRSIHFRLVAWYAGLLVAVSLAFGAYAYAWVHHYTGVTARETLGKRIGIIDKTLLSGIAETGEPFVIRELEARYAPAVNDRFIRVTRPDGTVMYVSGAPADGSFDPAQVPPATEPFEGEERTVAGGSLFILTKVCTIGDRRYLLEVGSSEREGQAVLHSFLLILAVGLPLVAAIVVTGGYFLISQALSPVKQIVGVAKNISLHHLDRRLPVARTGDELESLSVALNDMIARLDEAFQHAGRFSSDASHELRTPLTIMRGELEAALRHSRLDEEAREKIASVLEETERLAKVVEGLFAISRLESGEATMETSRFDLAHLVSTTADQIRLLAEDREIALTCEAGSCVEIEGDRVRLKQVVVNLLDNAIKYTPRGGRIHLQVRAEGAWALFRVTDNGKGIPEAALPHLFDRFYRADEARAQGIEGTGLGLSIVRSICAAHGGAVEAINQPVPPGGCSFIVRLPLPMNGARGRFFTREDREI